MTLVNRFILALGLVLLGTTITFAQQPVQINGAERTERQERKTTEERAEMRAQKLGEALELTEAQQLKVEALELKYAKAAATTKEQMRKEMKAQREVMKQNREVTKEMHDKELKAILTEAQAEKYEALKAERKAKMEEKRAKMKERRAAMKSKRSKVKASPNRY
ncbi:MAG: hypothetical protein AAGI23_12760 [Bacteroidota bacterium]